MWPEISSVSTVEVTKGAASGVFEGEVQHARRWSDWDLILRGGPEGVIEDLDVGLVALAPGQGDTSEGVVRALPFLDARCR